MSTKEQYWKYSLITIILVMGVDYSYFSDSDISGRLAFNQ